MTDAERKKIAEMTHEELARAWRFSPSGDFWSGSKGEYAAKRFIEMGGWNPQLSKKIGW